MEILRFGNSGKSPESLKKEFGVSHGDWDKQLVSMRTRYWARIVKEKAGFVGKRDQDFIDACRYGNTKLVELGA